MTAILPVLISVGVAAFIAIPMGMLILGSFSAAPLGEPFAPTLNNYARAFSDKYFAQSLSNTMVFSVGSTILAITISTLLAWVIVRTNTPIRRFAELLPIFPLLLPPMMDNIAWIFLISPRAGLINRFLEDAFHISPLFDAFTVPAMIWVYALGSVPLAYLIIVSAFTRMDPSLEEVSIISGAGTMRTLRTVTLPLMAPAILSAAILTFVSALRAFETPTLMGIPAGVYVFVSRIYSAIELSVPPDTGLATAYASLLLALTMIGVGLYIWSLNRTEKFQVVTGKGYRPRIINIGKWRHLTLIFLLAYFFVAVILPFVVVGVMSFMPYFSYSLFKENFFQSITALNYQRVFSHPLITQGFYTSIVVGIVSAGLAILIGAMTSYLVYRTRIRGRKALEMVGTIPIAFPGLVVGLALLWTFFYLPGQLYGTWIAVVIALIVFKLPIALRAMSGAVVQIHNELEEASRIHGASWTRTFRRVTLPLLKPAMSGAFIYLFLSAFREVGAVILLSGPGTTVAAVALFNYYGTGQWMELAAGAITFALVLLAVVLVGKFVFRVQFRL
ncbi:MAG: iron ABC transporter permease [Thaumarchaeota archaeon]|nr:iron ABC transporter permease [Nitrososphaerota archaeon]